MIAGISGLSLILKGKFRKIFVQYEHWIKRGNPSQELENPKIRIYKKRKSESEPGFSK